MEPTVSTANEEAIEAWDGVLFDRFVEFREMLVTGLGAHGDAMLEAVPPPVGGHAVDFGCGFGDTTQQIAELVGPDGSAHGIDSSARFIETAQREAAEAGIANVSFEVADIEAGGFETGFDYAFSRMGMMFFANPVAALRNVRAALKPGATLNMVVWRQKVDNEAMWEAEQVTERYLEHNDDSDEPTCGPGPFSMANADTVSGQLKAAGFTDVVLRRSDLPMLQGISMRQALDLVTAIGPAGEIIRLAGDQAAELRPRLEADIAEAFKRFEQPDGSVSAPTSCWLITATAP